MEIRSGQSNPSAPVIQPTTPQARGREMAAVGKKLWTTLGSVTRAATELMARYPDVPSLQAYRLIAEAYERLPIEDQLSLKQFSLNFQPESPDRLSRTPESPSEPLTAMPSSLPDQVGEEFVMSVPTVEHGNPDICVFTLPNPRPGHLLDLTWESFGYGLEQLSVQIKNVGRRLDVDVCFGVNEAGLVMATFMASARLSRCKIGYLRCNKIRDGITLDDASFFPDAPDTPTIVICDFEVKHADVVGYLARQLRVRYPKAELYFAVFGAMTKSRGLTVENFDDLTGAKIMRAAGFEAIFVAATMNPPGIEPPMELR
ncbi:hypothetical protein AB0L82_37440 [Nocardia sp. NPDC052001]|uniref:hypothetical protein n=1 Tax=Nocardia sp. NPDC052001 TaxID=3154853 RepID=UPI003417FCC1